jgi:hypothetical protein
MKKTFLASLLLFCAVTFPPTAHANLVVKAVAKVIPFGGLELFEIPCFCNLSVRGAIFAPLFFGPVPIAGTLALPVTPNGFSYYYSHPGAWNLGFLSVTPGTQAACLQPAIPVCLPIPLVLGIVTPFTGTSL